MPLMRPKERAQPVTTVVLLPHELIDAIGGMSKSARTSSAQTSSTLTRAAMGRVEVLTTLVFAAFGVFAAGEAGSGNGLSV